MYISSNFVATLSFVKEFTAKKQTHESYSGILLEAEGGILTVSALDGHAAARRSIACENEETFTFILSYDDAAYIIKEGLYGEFKVDQKGDIVELSHSSGTRFFNRVRGDFPPIADIYKRAAELNCDVNSGIYINSENFDTLNKAIKAYRKFDKSAGTIFHVGFGGALDAMTITYGDFKVLIMPCAEV